MQIGNVTLKNNIILAPMAGVSDLTFRLLCAEQGAGMVCMEMISAKAITYHNKNTRELMRTDPAEGVVSLQLFGSDPEIMAQAAEMIGGERFDLMDINMGCPVPKVVGNKEGSALMRDPDLVGRIVSAVCASTDRPVTVKIRKGFDDAQINAPEVALAAQQAGASAVTVHGRTREQYYSGRADWDIIREVKKKLRIPVIGNGDVTDPVSARRMLEYTGCDGIMIGRAARGNPWIFRQILSYQENGVVPEKPGWDEVKEMILRHARMQIEYKGEYIGIRQMRKHVAWYTTGMPGSAALRRAVNETETYRQLEMLLDKAKMRGL